MVALTFFARAAALVFLALTATISARTPERRVEGIENIPGTIDLEVHGRNKKPAFNLVSFASAPNAAEAGSASVYQQVAELLAANVTGTTPCLVWPVLITATRQKTGRYPEHAWKAKECTKDTLPGGLGSRVMYFGRFGSHKAFLLWKDVTSSIPTAAQIAALRLTISETCDVRISRDPGTTPAEQLGQLAECVYFNFLSRGVVCIEDEQDIGRVNTDRLAVVDYSLDGRPVRVYALPEPRRCFCEAASTAWKSPSNTYMMKADLSTYTKEWTCGVYDAGDPIAPKHGSPGEAPADSPAYSPADEASEGPSPQPDEDIAAPIEGPAASMIAPISAPETAPAPEDFSYDSLPLEARRHHHQRSSTSPRGGPVPQSWLAPETAPGTLPAPDSWPDEADAGPLGAPHGGDASGPASDETLAPFIAPSDLVLGMQGLQHQCQAGAFWDCWDIINEGVMDTSIDIMGVEASAQAACRRKPSGLAELQISIAFLLTCLTFILGFLSTA